MGGVLRAGAARKIYRGGTQKTAVFHGGDLVWERPAATIPTITVTGGTITSFTRSGVSYTQVEWLASGSFTVSGPVPDPQLALGAGGGSGGRGTTTNMGGGGGAGGLLQSTAPLSAGTYDVSIGLGGAATNTGNAGNSGTDSVISFNAVELLRALAGARGGTNAGSFNGGSGGGGRGGAVAQPGGTGTPGQGYNGGAGVVGSGGTEASGGGGGAGGPGGTATASTAGDQGAGLLLSWLATSQTVCIGGRGCTPSVGTSPVVTYGSGSNGRASNAVAAGANGFFFLVVHADQADVVMA